MTEQEKIDILAELLEVEDPANFHAATELADVCWDSMAMLSVMALAKKNGKNITGSQVREFKTVDEIIKAAF